MSTKMAHPMADIEIAALTDRLMRRIHGHLNANAPAFDDHNVGPSGGIVLMTLAEIEPARLQDLTRAMSRDKSQMTRLVRSLEGKGLLARAEDPGDARAAVLTLTDAGQKAVTRLQEAVAEALEAILAPLSDDERAGLKAMLRRL